MVGWPGKSVSRQQKVLREVPNSHSCQSAPKGRPRRSSNSVASSANSLRMLEITHSRWEFPVASTAQNVKGSRVLVTIYFTMNMICKLKTSGLLPKCDQFRIMLKLRAPWSTIIIVTSIPMFQNCKGNPLRFRLPPIFRFRFRPRSVLRFRSRHLVSLPQRLRSNDILCHPLPTRFRSWSHDVAWCRMMLQDSSSWPDISSDPPSVYDTLTRHVCCTLHVFPNFGLISYIHYFVY